MATPKLNPSRSISVIPSDYCNIPNPALYITEVNADAADKGYFTTSVDILALGIKTGDILYDYDNGYADVILSIKEAGGSYDVYYSNQDNNTNIALNNTVKIYNGEDDSTGCVLYVGSGGAIRATTEGGDSVLFTNVPSGSFLPVQVVKIGIEPETTNASYILALR